VTPFESVGRTESSQPKTEQVAVSRADRNPLARSEGLPGVALSTETEHALAAIWTELLGIEQIAADDSFFLLGGHSLMATRILVRIKDRFGANLVLRDVFDAPTLSKLAARIDEAASASAAAPLEDDDREELVF
jgi:acyl carrier protein